MGHDQHQRRQAEQLEQRQPQRAADAALQAVVGQRQPDQHQAQRHHRAAQQFQHLIRRIRQAEARQVPGQAGQHRQHHRVDEGVAQRAAQDVPQARALRLPRLAARQVQLDQRGQRRQQDEPVHADQHQVDAQARLAEHRCRHRDAHLHRVAIDHGDGAHRRQCGRGADAIALPSMLPAIHRQQQAQRRHEVGQQEVRWQRMQIDVRGGAEQQRRHEDGEGGVAQHPRRVGLGIAQPAQAAGRPAQRHGGDDRQQLAQHEGGHGSGRPRGGTTAGGVAGA